MYEGKPHTNGPPVPPEDTPIIAKTHPRRGYVRGQPETLSDVSALMALKSWAEHGLIGADGHGRQLVADAYAYLWVRLGISETMDAEAERIIMGSRS